MYVNVIGAGLAGCEAAYALANRGIQVKLYEQKPHNYSEAHHLDTFAELVCSNSLRSDMLHNGVGLLKAEMRLLGSLIMEVAEETKVPAGGALAVDREWFSQRVTERISAHENIEIIREEVTCIPQGEYTVIASGPLTSQKLVAEIGRLTGEEYLYFYDAAAPIVTKESIDMDKVFLGDRYDRGDADYINCPMTKEEYAAFYTALTEAEVVPLKTFEKEVVFEGCMPVETMAKRGRETLLFGPLKPVGLKANDAAEEPYAVVQLRQDNKDGSLYNMVGFQTHLKFGEQKRVFSMIPGLEQAEFVRYGVMHRNTFINSPKLLNSRYGLKSHPNLFFAGQITGVEGYIESASSGLLCGIYLARLLNGKEIVELSNATAIGALAAYVSNGTVAQFQPMNVNFGIMEELGYRVKGKKSQRNIAKSEKALAIVREYIEQGYHL